MTASGEFQPFISIVIPTRNEADDIAGTLDRCLALDYECKEILVVDDSTDDTPAIVATYADRGVRLIHREENRNGCCGARNLGLQQAQGEIVVLMNADDRPQSGYLRQILPHYQAGADYLIVRSTVANTANPWGKYTATVARRVLSQFPEHEEWSEGFSCRRSVAANAGYIPGDFPVPFCRDYMLGPALTRVGGVKQVDMTIPMEHIVPGNLRAYWRNQVWRGTFSAPHAYYFRHKSMTTIWMRELLKLGRTILIYGLIVPSIWRTIKLTSYAPNSWRDGPVLWGVNLVQDIALRTGNFKGLRRLMRITKTNAR